MFFSPQFPCFNFLGNLYLSWLSAPQKMGLGPHPSQHLNNQHKGSNPEDQTLIGSSSWWRHYSSSGSVPNASKRVVQCLVAFGCGDGVEQGTSWLTRTLTLRHEMPVFIVKLMLVNQDLPVLSIICPKLQFNLKHSIPASSGRQRGVKTILWGPSNHPISFIQNTLPIILLM